jgi:hypothetical protein
MSTTKKCQALFRWKTIPQGAATSVVLFLSRTKRGNSYTGWPRGVKGVPQMAVTPFTVSSA